MRSKSVRNLSEIKQSPAELLIILRIFARYVAPWPWPLTSWPWFFNSITGIIRLNSTEYERNRIIHGWVIDDLARFRRAILGSGDRAFLGVRGPSFTQLGKDIGRSSQHCNFVSEFGYLAAFSNAGAQSWVMLKNDAKFCTFWPPMKIRGEVG